MEYIEIDKDAIPYTFEMQLSGETWGFEVRYNAENDFFTIDLYKNNNLIAAGEKLIYNHPLFSNLQSNKPMVSIVPFDLSGNANRVGWDELNESVFLFLVGDKNEQTLA